MVTMTDSDLDIDQLEKGDYISSEVIQHIFDLTPDDDDYSWKCLSLRGMIETQLSRRYGRKVVVKSENNGLRVLTDSEAAEYNVKRLKQGKNQMFQAHYRNLDVDEANLSPVERQSHYRNLEVGSKYIQALNQVAKDLKVEAHKRKTPGIVAPK